MGYRLNRLDEPIFMAGPKPMRTEFGIHLRLESCGHQYIQSRLHPLVKMLLILCLPLIAATDEKEYLDKKGTF